METGLLHALKRMFATRLPLRPPGALPEAEFLRRCIRCNKCVQLCPDRSITIEQDRWDAARGTPVIKARDIPCYLCMKCPPVCPTGALDRNVRQPAQVRMGLAYIDKERCLAYNGVICRACFDECPFFRSGITLRDERYPEVIRDVCVGCGICEHVCPAEDRPAIRVRPRAADPVHRPDADVRSRMEVRQ
jgi:ferredoxin-type protein NapG